jgi:hypothetical protein
MGDEIRSIEHITSFFIIIISIIAMLVVFFNSKLFQLIVLMMVGSIGNTSYFHLIALYVLSIAFPFVCLILTYDAVWRDLEDERVRMIVTKVKRTEYIMAKLGARLVVALGSLAAIMLFVSTYSFFLIGKSYLSVSVVHFILLGLMSIFLSSLYIMISCFVKNPLFVSILVPVASFLLNSFPETVKFSFFHYVLLGVLSYDMAIFFIAGSLIAIMTTIYLFRRKQL